MVGAITQHNGHAKSQSSVIFLLRSNAGFRRHYTIIDLVSSSLKFTMYGGVGGGVLFELVVLIVGVVKWWWWLW